MEVLHSRCAGLDLSKRDAKVCIRIVPPGKVRAVEEISTWSSMTGNILALRDRLVAAQVTCVAMEATGAYWKPFYYLLEDAPFEVMLVNAHDAKNLPGRKTDVSDAAWLAQLAAHGLVRASFVPPPPIRELRDHTTYARAADEAHTLISQALRLSGDIIPGHDTLTIRLDPLPTRRATTAISQLCEHLTTTHTRYPDTNLTLRYEIKTRD